MREFRIKGKNKTLLWRVWVAENEVHCQYGTVDGKLQHTFDEKGPITLAGKLISGIGHAIYDAERKIRKKTEGGYIEVEPGTDKPLHPEEEVDILNELPKNLSFMKPIDSRKLTKKGLGIFNETVEGGDALYTAKRDGFMHPILITPRREVKIYTRRMDRCETKYPHLVDALSSSSIPGGTILLTELVVVTDGLDDRLALQAISNSKPERARALQTGPGKKANAVVLSVAFWDGKDLISTNNFGELTEFTMEQFDPSHSNIPYFDCLQPLFMTFEKAQAHCIEVGLEGMVVYDGARSPRDRGYNYRGKPERPVGCWKWKPVVEDDFVLVFDPDQRHGFSKGKGGEWGTGNRKKLPGSVALYQYTADGVLVYRSKCGSGFKAKQLPELLEKANANCGIIGVGEIHYTPPAIRDKDCAPVEPRFKRWTDKVPSECVNNDL